MQYITIESESCPKCGDNPIARNTGSDGLVYDSDPVRCAGCGEEGYASVDEDHFLIHWECENT